MLLFIDFRTHICIFDKFLRKVKMAEPVFAAEPLRLLIAAAAGIIVLLLLINNDGCIRRKFFNEYK